MSLFNTYTRGLINKSSYIRLAIAEPRYSQGDSYTVNIPVEGTTLQETLAEAALMVRDGYAVIGVQDFFYVTWFDPQALPSYTPTAVRGMKVSGRGYLYFALGAENPGRLSTQVVDPSRFYGYYSMSAADFLAELSRLLESKTAAMDVRTVKVTWSDKPPVTREFTNLTEAVTQLRTEIAAIASSNGGGGTVDLTEITNQINILTDEINDRQLRGDYALLVHTHNIDAIANAYRGRINLIEQTVTGTGVSSFELNPDSDSPGQFRVYLSTPIPTYVLSLTPSWAEGNIVSVNIISQASGYFDIAIADMNGTEQPTTEVNYLLLPL